MADDGVLDQFFTKVMADVLTSSREELLGEGLDVAVLQELQTRWQQKLQESKDSAAEARLALAAAPPPPPKAPKKRKTAASVAVSSEQPQPAPAPAPSAPVRGPTAGASAPDSSVPRHSVPAAPAAARPRNAAAAGPSAAAPSPAIDPMALLGHAMPAAPMGSFFLDFESGLPPVEPLPPMQDTNKRKEPPGAPSGPVGAAVAPANTGSAAAAVVEEEDEPLPSDDDDDDDTETSNLVVCQFEKVSHVKTKWKCTLLNGVMNLNGSEHVFNAGVGNFLLTF